jgi:hypothetical protein
MHKYEIRNEVSSDTMVLTYQYQLADNAGVAFSEVGAYALDGNYSILTTKKDMPTSLAPDTHSVDLYTITEAGDYKPVMYGVDNKAGNYHDHTCRRIIAVNSNPLPVDPIKPIDTGDGWGNVKGAWMQVQKFGKTMNFQWKDRRKTFFALTPAMAGTSTPQCIKDYIYACINIWPGWIAPWGGEAKVANKVQYYIIAMNGGIYDKTGVTDLSGTGQMFGCIKDGAVTFYSDEKKRRYSLAFPNANGGYMIHKDTAAKGTIPGLSPNTWNPIKTITAQPNYHSNLCQLIKSAALPIATEKVEFPQSVANGLAGQRQVDYRDNAWVTNPTGPSDQYGFIIYVWDPSVTTGPVDVFFIVTMDKMTYAQAQAYIINTFEPKLRTYRPKASVKDAMFVDGGASLELVYMKLPVKKAGAAKFPFTNLEYKASPLVGRKQPTEIRVTIGDTTLDADYSSTKRTW